MHGHRTAEIQADLAARKVKVAELYAVGKELGTIAHSSAFMRTSTAAIQRNSLTLESMKKKLLATTL